MKVLRIVKYVVLFLVFTFMIIYAHTQSLEAEKQRFNALETKKIYEEKLKECKFEIDKLKLDIKAFELQADSLLYK